MKVIIGTPCADGKIYMQYMQSLLAQTLMHPEKLEMEAKQEIKIGTYFSGGVSGLGRDRGTIASHALRAGADKLFMIDADQSWSWDDFKKIVFSDKPIICGVVPLKRYPLHLNFTPIPQDQDCFLEQNSEVLFQGLNRIQSKYQNKEVEVNRAGTAFMCVDMAVFRSLASSGIAPAFNDIDPYTKVKTKSFDFFQSGVVGDLYHGEDWGFCHQARHAGFKTYINPSVRIPHHGQHMFVIGEDLIKI